MLFRSCGSACVTTTGPGGYRGLFDLVGSYNATEKLTFVLNYDYGWQENASTATPTGNGVATWNGIAGYANYQFTDQWRGSLRAEYFDDKDGFRTGVRQQWKEVTYTLAYLPNKNIELRGEVRYDRSNGSSSITGLPGAFVKPDGNLSKNQASFALEALFKF